MSLISTIYVPAPSNVQCVICHPKPQVLTLPEKPLALQEVLLQIDQNFIIHEIHTGESLKARLIFVLYTTCNIHRNSYIPLQISQSDFYSDSSRQQSL